MPTLHKNITASADIHNPKWFPDANNGDVAWRNEKGELESTDELVLPAALNFVDASVAPPTTNDGDIYVLSSGGSVNAGWGAVSLDDWVRYDLANTTWNSITPQKSSLCYDKTTDALQFFDGTNWAAVATGIQNLTTAAKSALSPSTGDFVYDTDLDSLQRYDGAAWVDLAKGYGVIEVITDSDSGVPTYFTDLQTALETCKTSGSNNVVKLHSDISLSAQIDINYGGTGTGFSYGFESLTIDFNGFEVSFDDAGTTNTFSISLNSSSTSNQKLILLNGKVSRTSGTGTHQAFKIGGYGTCKMSQMVVYCQNSESVEVLTTYGTGVNSQRSDFGGSLFVSNASSGRAAGFINGENFKLISLGNADGFRVGTGGVRNAYIECKGSGIPVSTAGELVNCYIKSNTGDCSNGSIEAYNCQFYSTSGRIAGGGSLYNCYGETGDSVAINTVALVDNCTIKNNSSSATITFPTEHRNSNFINEGSGKVVDINFNTRIFDNCILISEGGIPVTTAGACQGIFKNCTIKSNWNNTGGHAMSLGHTSNTVYVANCILEVSNASANCLYAASAKNAAVGNCGFKGATTAINANVTVALTAAPDANGNYEL